jgi:hypothetical protein
MKKRSPKKLTLHRETLRHLAADRRDEVQGGGKVWSDPPQCDTACTSQTLSCTLVA